MAYLCVSNDCVIRPTNQTVDLQQQAIEAHESPSLKQPYITIPHQDDDEEFVIPEYVCCVLTEGVWTIFGACLLILILFTLATLKYFEKYLAKTKYNKKNLRMKDRYVLITTRPLSNYNYYVF